MAQKREGHISAAGFLLALDKINPNKFKPNDIRWKFTTGRLNNKTELELMTHFKTTNLSDAFKELGHGYEYYEGLRTASQEELIEKGWITKKDMALAKKLSKLAIG